MPTWEVEVIALVLGLWAGTIVIEMLHRKYKKAVEELLEAQRDRIGFLERLLSHTRTDGSS